MTIKVLVSGAGGDVGQGVLKSLISSSLDLELYATCISEYSSWLHKGITSFISPPCASDEYVDYLIRLIHRLGIQVFFPTVDSEIIKIAREKSRIEAETGAVVFVDELSRVSICDDKYKTAEFLRINEFPYPRSLPADSPLVQELISTIGYPVIVKKRVGKGNQEVYLISGKSELNSRIGNSEFMIQEWLNPDEGEYTSGIYLGDDKKVKGICIFRRQLKNGSTFIAERIIDPVLEAQMENIAKALGMKYLNVQFMKHGEVILPFEFNGRLSGTTAMISKVFNAPEMFIRERLLGEALERADSPFTFVAMRYYEEVYIEPEKIRELLDRSVEI